MFGFLAFNGGSTSDISTPGVGQIVAKAMINTIMCGAFAALSYLVIHFMRKGKWTILLTINACLTGKYDLPERQSTGIIGSDRFQTTGLIHKMPRVPSILPSRKDPPCLWPLSVYRTSPRRPGRSSGPPVLIIQAYRTPLFPDEKAVISPSCLRSANAPIKFL